MSDKEDAQKVGYPGPWLKTTVIYIYLQIICIRCINKERHVKYAEGLALGLELRTTALTVPL